MRAQNYGKIMVSLRQLTVNSLFFFNPQGVLEYGTENVYVRAKLQ
jgi:hypothetical protein